MSRETLNADVKCKCNLKATPTIQSDKTEEKKTENAREMIFIFINATH